MPIAQLVAGTLTGYAAAGLVLTLGLPLWASALTLCGTGSLATLGAAGLLAQRQTRAGESRKPAPAPTP